MPVKKIISTFLTTACILAGGVCYSQKEFSVLKFDNEIWDLGTIREADGKVNHTFTFTNTSSSPVIIENIIPECGCTTPNHSLEPIRPGGRGKIEMEFNPANFKGPVTKAVRVFSNSGKSVNRLIIKANIIDRVRTVEEKFPYTLGSGIRANNMHLSFAYIQNGTVNSMAVELYNSSGKRVELQAVVSPNNKNVKVSLPKRLAPKESAFVTVTYDLSAGGVYGIFTDKIYISLDGAKSSLPISTYAIAIDNFSTSDQSKAPFCVIEPTFHHFGKGRVGTIHTRKFTITNTGKSPLIIRDVSGRSNSSSDLKAGRAIAPGKSIEFTVSMIVTDGIGVKTGGISIITNDPVYPMREIRTAIEIEK